MFSNSPRVILISVFLILGSCSPNNQNLDPQQQAEQEREAVRLLIFSVQAMRLSTPKSLLEAQSALELAREIKPSDPRIYDGLGAVAYRKGELFLAEHHFKKAIAIDSLYDRAYAHLALIAKERGELETAQELLQIAVQLNPGNYRSRNNYSVVLAESGVDRRRAYQELLKAIRSQRVTDQVTEHNIEILAPESDLAK